MYKDLKQETGFGLLELLLVLVIAALLLIMGIRLYEKQKMQEDLDQARQNAQLLLHAAGNYYYAYCAQDIDGPPASITVPGYYDQYQRAQDMLGTPLPTAIEPKMITLASLQTKDQYGNQFLEPSFQVLFNFGSFTDGSTYRIQLVHLPYQSNQCVSTSSDQTSIPQNCFTQTGLWQTRVNACVTAFTTIKKDPKNPKKPIITLPNKAMIQAMFQPDEIDMSNIDCTNGVVITWESIPSIQQPDFENQGDPLSADQREFNQMYRYGPWMQQGALSAELKQKLEYLCQ